MKKEILHKLIKNKGSFISGQDISNEFNVTRAAIWKYIKQLKDDGYVIESVSRKGYRLISEPDTLESVVIDIENSHLKVGSRVHYFKKIDSTNTYAKEIANTANEGEVIISELQTEGRGRLGRQWESPKNTGIFMSIILKPNIMPIDAPKITQIAALATVRAIEDTVSCKVGIKWPNDIIIDNKKVCGILTEISGELNSLNYIIVGIGINVNQRLEDFPKDLLKMAISLKEYIGKCVSRKELTVNLLRNFDKLYKEFIINKNIKEVVEECKKYSVTLGKKVKVISGNNVLIGEAIDFDENGVLIFKKENGETVKIISGEVSVRGLDNYV